MPPSCLPEWFLTTAADRFAVSCSQHLTHCPPSPNLQIRDSGALFGCQLAKLIPVVCPCADRWEGAASIRLLAIVDKLYDTFILSGLPLREFLVELGHGQYRTEAWDEHGKYFDDCRDRHEALHRQEYFLGHGRPVHLGVWSDICHKPAKQSEHELVQAKKCKHLSYHNKNTRKSPIALPPFFYLLQVVKKKKYVREGKGDREKAAFCQPHTHNSLKTKIHFVCLLA